MNNRVRYEIAARIRDLIGREASLKTAAKRLGVAESALRMSVADVAPFPGTDVVAAVVREYGVDPMWLLTGVYNPAAHRASLELTTDELPAAIRGTIRQLEFGQ